MFGAPVRPPRNASLLRMHWQYHIKRSERRSRSCCDGSPQAAPMLHQVASTYSSCVEQPVQRLFFALAAAIDMKVYGGDAQDAFAHSSPPATPTFIIIDDAYADWYKAAYGVDVDRRLVLLCRMLCRDILPLGGTHQSNSLSSGACVSVDHA
jgi:hypothetical protein